MRNVSASTLAHPASSYLHNLYTGVAFNTPPPTYPDGDPRPSVTFNMRATYVIKPNISGTISMILGPYFYGCLTILAGDVTGNYAALTGPAPGTAGTIPGWSLNLSQTGGAVGQLPMATTGFAAIPGGRSNLTAFRPLVAVAEFSYTGTSYLDSGSVTVGTVNNVLYDRGSSTVDAPTDYNLHLYDCTAAGNVGSVSSMPSSRTFAARDNFVARVAPACPVYSSSEMILMRDNDDQPLSLYRTPAASTTVGSTVGVPCSPYSTCCPWKAITYNGLDQSASITVSVRYSVQCIVDDDSSFAPLAMPSKPALSAAVPVSIEKGVAAIPTVEAPGFLSLAARHIREVDWPTVIGRGARAYMGGDL